MGDASVCWFCLKKRRRADGLFVKGLRKKFKVAEVLFEEEAREKGVFLYV